MNLLMETPLFEELVAERVAQAEQARLLAEQKAARLTAQLRELGIDPEA
ncbi:hypothetical protein [Anthocerotibacter panamensis]|nr:hypothetical protein [Anthocerotibacter panamensis]